MTTITITLDKRQYYLQAQMIDWCNTHIGKNSPKSNWVWAEPKEWQGLGEWAMASAFGNTFFYFKHEKDATAFALRWL